MRRGRFSEITILAQIPLHSKTLAQPGVGGKPRAAREVFRNHNTGPNSLLFKTLARAGVGGKPRAAGKVFRNHNTGLLALGPIGPRAYWP